MNIELSEAGQVRMLFVRLVKKAKFDFEARMQKSGLKLTVLQYAVLRYIHLQNLTIKDLAEKMLINPAALVSVIDDLEKNGFLLRLKDPKDRRKTPLQITKKGELVLSKISYVAESDFLAKALNKAGQKKTGELLKILQELSSQI